MAPQTSNVDLTPDPRVLRALTHTPLRPIDALCELIDNSLDSFQAAARSGAPIPGAMVILEIPTRADLADGGGKVVVRDNGPGMSIQEAEKALRAGFSGNNPFDTLGLFGMGFNIASGKLGTRTRFLSTRRSDTDRLAAQIVVDLPEMERAGHYRVPVEEVKRPASFDHGTLIEVSGWWPAGNPNRDFVGKLAAIPKTRLREEIGRRYATVLRRKGVRIVVNGDDCVGFEHCVWSERRSVERQVWGRIPARMEFSESIGFQTRCAVCYRLLESEAACPSCGSGTAKRTIEEMVRGWVGIQRYDDADHFGIDLIRNGRAIRVLEKEAFFSFSDELGRKIQDYPIDGPHGRIVGEVHLDHVPVDFMKQDFQRSTREWDDAVRFLRGASSLQPKQKGAETNTSPVFRLYQGYRRVRNVGKRDLYMGAWDPQQESGVRISRDIEREMLKKFEERQPGYYDDSEWWKLVEAADEAPVRGLRDCSSCGSQVLETDEVCRICASVLRARECASCGAVLPESAESCNTCGAAQTAELTTPWVCAVCGDRNSADEERCEKCGSSKGTKDPLSDESLREQSVAVDSLSVAGLTIVLADRSNSVPINVEARAVTGRILAGVSKTPIPCYSITNSGGLSVFIDQQHEAFAGGLLDAAHVVAMEAARRIHGDNLALMSGYPGLHSVSRIAWLVLQRMSPAGTAVTLRERALLLFTEIGERLAASGGGTIETMASEMDERIVSEVLAGLRSSGRSILEFPRMAEDGSLAGFLPPDFVVAIARKYPELFFDGRVFNEGFEKLPDLPPAAIDASRAEVLRTYVGCLDDCAHFIQQRRSSRLLEHRTRYAIEFLERQLS